MTKEQQRYGRRLSSGSRPLALEQAYVHDVYSIIAINASLCSPVRSHVKEFLFDEFDTGSLLLDIGCSDGKYLNLKSDVVLIGLERCGEWFSNESIKNNTKELIAGDVMYLPFRDDFFDGVICCGVLHHISTAERRVKALREMTRIMKIGAKLMITVTSGPAVGRELQSQDVLIKLDDFHHKLNANTNSSETESESSSSGYSNSNYGNTLYESCNSPNSEFGSCYSFVRKALRKFSFTGSFGSLQSRRTSNKSKTSNSSSVSKEEFPIELRNIEDEESVSVTNDSPVECDFSSLQDNSKSRSNLLNSSSLLSIIKEHIISFQFQFKQKNSVSDQKNSDANKRNGFLSQHRFSLPISFKRNDNQKTGSNLNMFHKCNKYLIEESQELSSNTSLGDDLQKDSKPLKNIKDKAIKKLQKSFSSDSLSSRQASWDATGGRLIAYYSMPELHTLTESNDQNHRMSKYKPKLIDLHPITFISAAQPLDATHSQRTESKTDSKTESSETELTFDSHRGSQNERTVRTDETSEQTTGDELNDEKESLLEREEMDDFVKPEESAAQILTNNKFPKKLLRQRSFSADYQPEVPKPQSEQPRRFSASPNIGSSRANPHSNQYYNQMSIDSEESFITIIPANRSTRESVTEAINNSDTFADLEAECLSSSTDDACCEDIEGGQTSDDNTSASSVTEVTKSTAKSPERSESECQSSTPSPPTTLHRYFHVFRSGELEQLIEQNIQNLHVINSYYNERATSWCVVVEKVHVWTI